MDRSIPSIDLAVFGVERTIRAQKFGSETFKSEFFRRKAMFLDTFVFVYLDLFALFLIIVYCICQ